MRKFWRTFYYVLLLCFISLRGMGQEMQDSAKSTPPLQLPISAYIEKFDTLIHFEPWFSSKLMEYRLYYKDNFKLFLRPTELNTLSLGFFYRYLDISMGFSPSFINQGKPAYLKDLSKRFEFSTGFSISRFYLSLDFSNIKGFYLRNSEEYIRNLPDTPKLLFPNLQVFQYGAMVNYNLNPRFSRSGMKCGAQSQLKSAMTFMPAFQFARFRFRDNGTSTGIENDATFSTDINLIFPAYGTLVLGKRTFISGGFGPSIGMDWYRSLSYNNTRSLVQSKGSSVSLGYLFDFAAGYNGKRLYGGFQGYIRTYGHTIENLDKMQKVFYSGHFYIGWRFRPPGWTKRTLDWVNKKSPIQFE